MSELFKHWNFPTGFEKALADGADPNAPSSAGTLPLHEAVGAKRARYVELLLEAGADVNKMPPKDSATSALARAIDVKDWKLSAVLLEAGADPTLHPHGVMATDLMTPLNWAFANDNKIAREIRKRGEATGHTFGAAGWVLPFELEKAMGKLTGGYKRSLPYSWVKKVEDLQAELVRLGGQPVTAQAVSSLESAHVLPRLIASAFAPGSRFRAAPGSTTATWLDDRSIQTTEALPTTTALDPDRHAKSLKKPFTPFAIVGSNIEIATFGKNIGEMVVGWDREEPSDDITFSLGRDLDFLRTLEPADS